MRQEGIDINMKNILNQRHSLYSLYSNLTFIMVTEKLNDLWNFEIHYYYFALKLILFNILPCTVAGKIKNIIELTRNKLLKTFEKVSIFFFFSDF